LRTFGNASAPSNKSAEATIELTLTALRKAGVYDHAIITWEDKDAATQTWDAFQLHFSKQEKLRLKKLTAAAAGHHGANKAAIIPPDDQSPPKHHADAAQAKDTRHYFIVGATDSESTPTTPAKPAATPSPTTSTQPH
jgi:hypothetical protein